MSETSNKFVTLDGLAQYHTNLNNSLPTIIGEQTADKLTALPLSRIVDYGAEYKTEPLNTENITLKADFSAPGISFYNAGDKVAFYFPDSEGNTIMLQNAENVSGCLIKIKNQTDKKKITYFIGNGSGVVTYDENGYYVSNTVNDVVYQNDALKKTNTTEYTPTAEYHPSTKKYVDETVAASATTLDAKIDDFSGVRNVNFLKEVGATVEAKWNETSHFTNYNITFDPATVKTAIIEKYGNNFEISVGIPDPTLFSVKVICMFADGRKSYTFIPGGGTPHIKTPNIFSFHIWLDSSNNHLTIDCSHAGATRFVCDENNNRIADECLTLSAVNDTNVLMTSKENKANYVPTKDWQPTDKKYVDNAISSINIPTLIVRPYEDLVEFGATIKVDESPEAWHNNNKITATFSLDAIREKLPLNTIKSGYFAAQSDSQDTFSFVVPKGDGTTNTQGYTTQNSGFLASMPNRGICHVTIYRDSSDGVRICYSDDCRIFQYSYDASNARIDNEWKELYKPTEKNVLLTNATNSSYTPTEDYHPSTKKYVDDSVSTVNGSVTTLDSNVTELTSTVSGLNEKLLDYSNKVDDLDSLITNHVTSDPTWENVYDASQTAPQMQAGKFYHLGTITEAMSYTLLPGAGDCWSFSFMTGSTAPQVTHPAGVLCSDFTVSANCLHEISIRKESDTYYAMTFRKWEIPTAS